MQKERIFLKSTIGNESLHEINDNGVGVVKSATDNFIVKRMFPHRNIHKYIWTYGKIHNQIDHILIDTRWHSNILEGHYTVVAKVRDCQ
jgi:hypothetical protein